MSAPREDDASYKAAGVDVEAGERAVDLIRRRAAAASRPEVIGGIGGFAGLFAPRLDGMAEPVLVSASDGVGTKLLIAQALDRHDTVGFDLVAMVVDDIVCYGAEPLFLVDYVACGRLVPERIAAIVGGIADACRAAGCALLGGETAEHPGAMDADAYDLAAFGVGLAERSALWGPDRVRTGDALVGLASSGLHSNGYSLVRKILLDLDLDLHEQVPELGAALGDELLRPTRIYAPSLLALAADVEIHAAAHVTGGGIASNVSRVVPAGLSAVVRSGTWHEPPIFRYLAERARMSDDEMRDTFNCGLGMVLIVPGSDADRAVSRLKEHGEEAAVVGEVTDGGSGVTITP